MTLIYRPWGNSDLDLTGAVLVAEGTLPQTISGLPSGSYEIGRISWDATQHIVVNNTAPLITVQASVSAVDNGTTVEYTFVAPQVSGTPTPTVTRVLTVDGTDVTSSMVGDVYTASKVLTTQALVMTYTATNIVSPSATSTVSATIPVLPTTANIELLNEVGSSTITSVPNLRISVNGGTTFHALTAVPGHPGLTIARHADGDKLVISGWAGGVVPAGLRVHYEQALPEEPNNPYGAEAALFARRVGDTGPINPKLPGMSIAPTIWNAPVGVT